MKDSQLRKGCSVDKITEKPASWNFSDTDYKIIKQYMSNVTENDGYVWFVFTTEVFDSRETLVWNKSAQVWKFQYKSESYEPSFETLYDAIIYMYIDEAKTIHRNYTEASNIYFAQKARYEKLQKEKEEVYKKLYHIKYGEQK